MKVLILDFGSQYTQLIARRIRELEVYAEIIPYFHSIEDIRKENPSAIILSGGPSSIYDEGAPRCAKEIFDLGVPVLGICYGLYLVVDAYGGKAEGSTHKEYGRAVIDIKTESPLFKGLGPKETVWMSHGDRVTKLPDGFELVASSENAALAAVQNVEKRVYGIQFHPEVFHSEHGKEVLSNFLFNICKLEKNWNMKSFVEHAVESIRKEVGDGTVLLGLSGGVDSTVTAVLLKKAIGDRLYCVFVDNGVLRKNEAQQVVERYTREMKLNLIHSDASELFLKKLKGVTDPEKKRKIVGERFIRVFE
ncbi:MAG TPA: glutamine-hydrolyzing GMP synthase, partial [Spirochaetota bacterium]|nr:glutamine-hydrolyzing GMP synthase [Spirochaetota bacterium]